MRPDALQEENRALHERVVQLEHMLLNNAPAIPATWFLTPMQYRVVKALRDSRRCLSWQILSKIAFGHDRERGDIGSVVHRVNLKMQNSGYQIRCLPGVGYRFELMAGEVPFQ